MRVGMHVGQLLQRVPGGIARYLYELVGALRAQEIAVVPFAAGTLPRALQTDLPGYISLGHPYPPVRYELWHRFRRPQVSLAVDVLHAPSLAIPPTRLPLVVTVNDVAFLRHPEAFTRRGLSFHRRGLELARRQADAIVVPSEFTRHELAAEGFDTHRVFVARHGVTWPRIPDPATIDRHLRALSIEPPYVLAVGTIEPRKNLPVLAQAIERLRVDHPDLQLVLAGPRGWLDVPRLDRPWIRELGAVDETTLDALYQRAAVYALPSRYEGFGLPVLEAMARGCAVAGADAGSIPEVVGDAGLVVAGNGVDGWTAALGGLLDDPSARQRLAEAGLSRAAEFTWAGSVQCHLEAYEAALGRAPSHS